VRLEGTHALVTGGSRGIGRDIAAALAARGARVTIVARDPAALERAGRELGAGTVVADLSDLEQVGSVFLRAEADQGPVGVLVNNAGVQCTTPLAETESEVLRAQMVTNLLTPLELSRVAVRDMLARGVGAVVNISSVAGDAAMGKQVGYCSSKAGLTAATRCLQRELRGTGVHAMLVALGLVTGTDMEKDLRSDPVAEAMLGRFGMLPELTPAEVGRRVADGIESGRSTLVLPAIAAPMHYLNQIPTRLVDALLLGTRSPDKT
jgi:NAD(P)-dependent dehydrogenase (short-subunit alcohol dehydrogenase family)